MNREKEQFFDLPKGIENSSALLKQHKIVNIYADDIVCKGVEEKVTEKSNIKKFPNKKKCLQKNSKL